MLVVTPCAYELNYSFSSGPYSSIKKIFARFSANMSNSECTCLVGQTFSTGGASDLHATVAIGSQVHLNCYKTHLVHVYYNSRKERNSLFYLISTKNKINLK